MQHRLLALTRGKAGGLIYEKDVFGRLSLWFVNLASSNLYNRQMTTMRHVERIYIPKLLYSSFWRGLTALSILCREGNARAYEPRMGRRTGTYAFFVYQGKHLLKNNAAMRCLQQENERK